MIVGFRTDRLPTALGQFAVVYPDTRVTVVHSSSASQLDAVRAGELDVGLVRDRPNNPLLDAVVAVRESMGVILAAVRAEEIGWNSPIRTARPGKTR
ncbi:LysR substrate-binding domain-containing protein [Pseudonocardia sp. CA-142604]|uniref:LysR substrate-binding domain-containing protein n=1 Tax=Pseudonocardia sp. CA-142604 TaxID=3240024 RepID=UPI003D91304B